MILAQSAAHRRSNGDLPPGVHFATWRELEDRFSFNPRRHRMLAGFRQAMEELREQVEAYERLNAGRSKEVVLEAVEDLPKALIRARIAAGMTQEGLARRLGVKPQQVQRYEATEYESASFARIRKVVQALGLSMPKAVRLVRNG